MSKLPFVLLLLITLSCGKSSQSESPEKVAMNYLNALKNKDWELAKTFSTKETAENLDMMKSIKMDFGVNEVSMVKCNTTDTVSICDFCCSQNPNFTEITLKKRSGKWVVYQPKETPSNGEVNSDQVENNNELQGEIRVVIPDIINLRSGPGAGYNNQGSLTHGTHISVLETKTGAYNVPWYKIRANDRDCWICGLFTASEYCWNKPQERTVTEYETVFYELSADQSIFEPTDHYISGQTKLKYYCQTWGDFIYAECTYSDNKKEYGWIKKSDVK